MRILIIASLAAFFSLGVHADAIPSAPSLNLTKVELIQQISVTGTSKLIGHSGGRFFLSKPDGSVRVVSATGKDEMTLANKGRKGELILKQPEAVTASNDNIYVADSELNQIAMFNHDGKFMGSLGGKGSDAGKLRSPKGLAWHDGVLYVADSGNGRIAMFGDNGVFLGLLEIESTPANKAAREKKLPYQLHEPISIAIDPAGRFIYVLDIEGSLFSSTASIKVYDPEGAFQRQLPQHGRPVAIGAGFNGVYAADADGFSIQKFDPNGNLISTFGSRGEGHGQFSSISGLAVERGNIYIGDSARSLILTFRTDAPPQVAAEAKIKARTSVHWTSSIPTPSTASMAWNGKDTLYAIARNDTIFRIRNGSIEGEIHIKAKNTMLSAITLDKNGALWVLDSKNGEVIKLDDSGNPALVFGASGSKNGQFDAPADIAISSNGIIFVADTGNARVQAFSDDGVFLSSIDNSRSGKLKKPAALALDLQDNLYVLDTSRNIIASYSAKGEAVSEFGQIKNDDSASLKEPRGIMATAGEILVAEADSIKVYTHDGHLLRTFGAAGKENGEFSDITAITGKDATSFFIAERANKRIQTLTTLYKPAPPLHITAQGDAHAINLQWAPADYPYIAQFQIYRAKNESGPFLRIGTTKASQYNDDGMQPGEKYFYRIAAETTAGFEGIASQPVSAIAQKYNPHALENIQVIASAKQLKFSWNPLDTRYISTYIIYSNEGSNFIKIGETRTSEFIKGGLIPATDYTFYISALSVDGLESEKSAIHGATIVDTSMPLDINVTDLQNVFSNTYKLYEQEGIGIARLTNNTDAPQKNIRVGFVLNNFMDYPTESKIDELAPGESKEVPLKAVFNNNLLSLTEDTPVQAKVEASYYLNGQKKVFSTIKTINIYDKHRLMWNEQGRYAAFITPKDPVLFNFSRSVASQFSNIKEPTLLAAAVFDALGVTGVTYVPDPSNPYQATSGKADTVDYIQYPRETLQRKSGDCDDLTALYASTLEGMGIQTRVLLVPGHMLMMFSTGADADEDNYTMNNMYVLHEGSMWIPVETTLLGKSFAKAWEAGAMAYYKWKDQGLSIFDAHEAWQRFKPATLPDDSWKGPEFSRASIEKSFPGDLMSTLKISSQTKTRRYLQAIRKDPSNLYAYLQVGIILAKADDREEARKYFRKILDYNPKHAAALNNLGNLFMQEGQFQNAQKYYLDAAAADPQDAAILVNLSKSYKATKDTEHAKAAFIKAQRLDPTISDQHKALALELLNGFSSGPRKPSSPKKK